MKTCTTCKIDKPLCDFSLNKKIESKIYSRCKKCLSEKANRWNKNNPQKRKVNRQKYDLKTRYGLTPLDVLKMLENQNEKCLICNLSKKLVVDHSHKTGKVRGLLCGSCNRGLGYLMDNPTLLIRAAEYVTKNS